MISIFKKKIKDLFDHETKRLAKNSVWVFVSNFYGVILAFVKSIIIARGLGAETLGIYTVIIAFVLNIQEIIKLNVPIGIVKYGSEYISENRIDKLVALLKYGIFLSLTSATISVIVIWLIIQYSYSYFISAPHLEYFIIWYSIINGIGFLDNISRGTLKIFFKFKKNSMVQITMDTIEFIAITLCIILSNKNLDLFLIVVLVTKLLNSGICNIAAFIEIQKEVSNHIKCSTRLINDRKKEISTFIIGHSFGNTLKTLMNQGDVLLLNYFTNPTAVGIYAISKKLGYAILAITDPLVTTIYPQISQLVSKKKFKELKIMLIRISKLTTIPLIVISLIVFIYRSNIIILFYGKEYAIASNTFFIHFLGAAQSAIFFWALPLIQSMNLAKPRLFTYTTSMIIGIALATILTPNLGASGIALSLLSTNIVITILFIYYANNEIKINLNKSKLA